MTSGIVIVVVLALLGTATYALTGGFTKNANQVKCSPPTSPICGLLVNTHDLSLLIPFRAVQQGQSVPFTVGIPSGENAASYSFLWGDGTSLNGTHSITASHNYSAPGIYLVEVTAFVSGQTHDSLAALQQITVTPASTASNGGTVPSVSGKVAGNSTTPAGIRGATAVLLPGGSVTVSASYTAAPTNPVFTENSPKIVLGAGPSAGVSLSNLSAGNGSASSIGKFSLSGTYTLIFVGSASNGNFTAFQNYTWTVLVAPPGVHAGLAVHKAATSPHPGTIINYELAPGGAASEDPAIDYETVGAEPIYNVYQTLITYNGSLTGPGYANFVPDLATCVPGSPQCAALYGGNTLQNGNDYTFVISSNMSFYDGLTHAHWGVYPSDVVFSIARSMGFSTLPCVGCNNGWIITQALLPSGNSSWDPIHGPYNNTPQRILASMSVNDSSCPAAALANDHGCVTFHASGNGHSWPYFLELVADPLGGAVVSCGWFSSNNQGAGIPFWTSNNVTDAGDHPCGMPGTPGYGVSPSSPNLPYVGWDRWEQLGSGAFGTFLGHVQYGMLGSGPYYMATYDVGTAYTMQANPYYGQNPHCTWKGCLPASGNYASTVEVTWETAATPGEQAYAGGTADHASIPSTDLALLLELIQQGKVNAISAPTLTIGFSPFNMNFDIGTTQRFTTTPVNVPTDWFSYLGMRQFFIHAYPYATVEKTINTRDGIQLAFDYGGAIPQFMANYYPTNIPWPNTDPCTDSTNSACAAYWWAQMQDHNSPYFDPEVGRCSSASPCSLPLVGTTGSAANDQINSIWTSEISSLSGGAVRVSPVDLNFVQVIVYSEFSAAGQNPMPIYGLGWAPDYPDPTDYVTPLYLPNATYTAGDAVMQGLLVPQFTQNCAHGITDYNYYANTTFPQSCQGIAYKALIVALNLAAGAPAGPYRVLLYDLAEKIAFQLGLYVYNAQDNQVSSVAAWVDPSTINTNVTIGGGGDATYFWLTGNGVQYAGST